MTNHSFSRFTTIPYELKKQTRQQTQPPQTSEHGEAFLSTRWHCASNCSKPGLKWRTRLPSLIPASQEGGRYQDAALLRPGQDGATGLCRQNLDRTGNGQELRVSQISLVFKGFVLVKPQIQIPQPYQHVDMVVQRILIQAGLDLRETSPEEAMILKCLRVRAPTTNPQ